MRATFERIRANLARTGGHLEDIVTMTVFIKDMQYGTHFTQIRREYFSRGYPCSALIGISALARPEMMVEIQAIRRLVGDLRECLFSDTSISHCRVMGDSKAPGSCPFRIADVALVRK